MTGGQLQLNSYKRNDSFLTVNPQKTFFRKVYHQYNNFAKINFTIDFTHIRKDSKFNEINNFNLTIPKYGHLIKECYIYLTLPKIFNDNYDIKWIKDLQFKIIKNIRFKIGGTVIQEFNSDLLYFYYTLLSTEKKDLESKGIILCGLCQEEMIKIPNESVDLTVTSPPYSFDIRAFKTPLYALLIFFLT